MNIFYMVEMKYPDTAPRADFEAFYEGHVAMLLTIEGFLSAQRFECVHPARAPFLAIYQLADPSVMTREAYTSKAGRMSVDPTIRQRVTNWDRNLVAGATADMHVPMGGWMVLIDRLDPGSPALPDGFVPLNVIGLDKTIAGRGFRIGATGEPAPPAAPPGGWIVRTLRPIHPPRFPRH